MSPQTGSQPRRTARTGTEHSTLEQEKTLVQITYKSVHTMMRGVGEIKDLGDAAAASNERDLTVAIANMSASQLRLLEDRRLRVNNGEITPGICENCEGKIPEARMKAIPWATRCTACEELKEQQIA